MTLVCGALTPRSASVVITLDTTPPVLHISGAARLKPEEVGTYLVRSNEPMGRVNAVIFDAVNDLHALGAVRVDDYTIRVTLPAAGLPGGSARIMVAVTDRACNGALAEMSVYIDRPTTMDLYLYSGQALDIELRQDRLYEMVMTATRPTEEMRPDGE